MIDAQIEGDDDAVDRLVQELRTRRDERMMHQKVMSVMHGGGH